MKRWRIALVIVIVLILVAGHANDVLTQREHWPFSMYPMYAIAQTEYEMKLMKLVGVTDENPPREMVVDGGGRWMRGSLGRFAEGPTANPKKLHKGLEEYLKMYDKRASEPGSGMIPLTALRLYEYKWDLRSERLQKLADEGIPLEKMPAERTLLGELTRGATTQPSTGVSDAR